MNKINMPIKRGGGGSVPDSPQKAPGPLTGSVEIVAVDYVESAGTADRPKSVEVHLWIKGITDELQLVICEVDDLERLFNVMEALSQAFALRTGALPTLEVVDQAPNANDTLPAAIKAFLEAQPLIKALVPQILKKFDMDQFIRAVEQIDRGKRIVRAFEPLIYGATALVTQGQKYVDDQLRLLFNDFLDKEMTGNFTLGRDLEALRVHFKKDVIAAADTKHLTMTVAHNVEAETLDRVKKVLGETGSSGSGGQPPPTGTGGTGKPPVLPDPQHHKPSRKGTSPSPGKIKKKPTPPKPAQ